LPGCRLQRDAGLWLLGNGLICIFLSVVLGEDQPSRSMPLN
jgi:hypothetical protein